jgi:hypothetical protein
MVGVSITDDAGTAALTSDDWTMTKTSGYVSGDTDNDGALDLTEESGSSSAPAWPWRGNTPTSPR